MRGSQDAAATEAVAVVLMVGVGMIAATYAIPMLAWCPTCDAQAPPSTMGARWASCELAQSTSFPACDLEPGEVVITHDGAPSCHLQVQTSVDQQNEVAQARALVCEVAAAATSSAPFVSTQGG